RRVSFDIAFQTRLDQRNHAKSLASSRTQRTRSRGAAPCAGVAGRSLLICRLHPMPCRDTRPRLTENIQTDPFEGVSPALRSALLRRGFAHLTPVQRAVVAAPSRERDLRISSQTGSGKTVAMGLALADELLEGPPRTRRSPIALVITPTRERAVQVRDGLAWPH